MKTAIWHTGAAYRALKAYTYVCTRTCFRKMTFTGRENIPENASVIIASNHCCTLVDPLVMLNRSCEATSFGARADIFRKPVAAFLLRFLKMLPIARMQDGKSAMIGNTAVFDEIVDVIGHGVPFCLYPEGTHHPGYEIHPLKSGAARIALIAASSNCGPVYIVPAGLTYSDFFTFMPDVEVKFGKPMAVSIGDDIRAITEELQARIQELVRKPEPETVTGGIFLKRALAVLSLPLIALCGVLSSPILLLTAFLSSKLKDRAWINTVRFASRFFFFPLWPFHSLLFLLLRYWRLVFRSAVLK